MTLKNCAFQQLENMHLLWLSFHLRGEAQGAVSGDSIPGKRMSGEGQRSVIPNVGWQSHQAML